MKCQMRRETTVSLGVLFFFLFLLFFGGCVSGGTPSFWEAERSVLLELKRGVSDPDGVLSSWDVSDLRHCSWLGVSCGSDSRVVALRIAGERGNSEALSCSLSPFDGGSRVKVRTVVGSGKLRGKISPLVGKLGELRVLSLPYNDLIGEIPEEIWGLEKLEVLDLEGNSLTGELPGRFWGLRRLRVLNLGFNRVSGEIPVGLSECRDLKVLNLGSNAVTGTIPGFLGGLSKLRGLYLSRNRLIGDVPAEIGSSCENLEHLDLSGNSLVGGIPSSLGNCQRLRTLLLFSNMLNGVIPSELGQLRMLEVLDVSGNSLSGPIPAELGQCIRLSVLVLSGGDLSVQLFSGVRNDDNHFDGSIPVEVTALHSLRIVWAPSVGLQGKLPQNWGSCENLEMVNLARNLFEGEVFGVFEKCQKLHHLDLSSNKLTGRLDEKLPVPCMTVLNVSGNLLSGPVPRFMDRICSHMHLSSDLFQVYNPALPHKLFFACKTRAETNLPVVRSSVTVVHDLSGNSFSGPIQPLSAAPKILGKEIVYAFLVGGNKLTGPVPESLFGKCNGLKGMILNVSKNGLSGQIPRDIGAMCRSLMMLDASSNEISGVIPRSLGDLTSLVVLDLSRNKLDGEVPWGMSHLKHLKFLSLDDNNLIGPLPRSVGWLNSLEVLDNNNDLHGQILPRLTNMKSPLTTKFSLILRNNNAYRPSRVLTSLAVQAKDEEDASLTSQSDSASHSEDTGSNGDSGLNSIEVASIASASAIVVVLLALIVLFFYTRKWMPDSRVQGLELREITVFSNVGAPLTFESIVRATGNFSASNCIGHGGFGATYKAEIHPGVIVAVKRLSVGRCQGDQQFHAEIKTLGRVRHPNLVTLVGYHASEIEMFLIYNFLPGGNLENFIKERSPKSTEWKTIHKIALDIAHALAYLHDQCVPRVLHRDVKPSNILLDNNLNAYLSDFGLSRLLGTSETHATTGVKGTFGYLAPEYAMTCRVSDKSDVYSYGVVLLELISDKRPLDPSFSSHGDGFNIVSWATMLLKQGRAKEVFTAGLWEAGPHDDLVEMLHLAVTCTNETLSIRPTMKHVVQRLKRIKPLSLAS